MSLNYYKLEKRFEEIGNLENILNILNWDISCNMKPSSEDSRSKEIVSLSKIIRQLLICDETKQIIFLVQKEEKYLDSWQKENLHKIILKIKNEEIISEELQKNLILSTTKAEIAWRTSRINNDYELFKPYFKKVLYYKKELAKIRSQKLGLSLYDSLIDQFDHGNTTKKIKKTFDILKEKLPLLIKKILKKQELKYKNDCIYNIPLDIKKQKDLNYKIMSIFGFDFNQGRLDESIHPFCGGTPYDIRLTTRYDLNNFFSSFFSVMHELGHALYEQNLPLKYKNQPVGKSLGFQFHESQSLLIEKQVSKSKEFLIFLSNYLRKEFNLYDSLFQADNLYFQANRVKPDFIRVDSDEVTYSLHIILRFEIEELLINDKLSLDDLPNLWNQKMKKYLGIEPKNFTEGCLQDVHWSSGSFGYFPSYVNGMIISSMMMKKYNFLYPNYKKDFLKGDFTNLNQYLNKNFRCFGSFCNVSELLLKVTDEKEINPYVFLEYLENKYLN